MTDRVVLEVVSVEALPLGSNGSRRAVVRWSDGSVGARILYGQRVNGIVRVTDKPASGGGRSFLVERGLTSNRELEALVADYISESERRDEPAAIVRVGDELGGSRT